MKLFRDSFQEMANAMNIIGRARTETARRVLIVLLSPTAPSKAECAGGAREPIFNGRDLAGWHVSATNHHGQTHAWGVEDGVFVGGQERGGVGGVLLTNRRYRDVEVALDVWPDFG